MEKPKAIHISAEESLQRIQAKWGMLDIGMHTLFERAVNARWLIPSSLAECATEKKHIRDSNLLPLKTQYYHSDDFWIETSKEARLKWYIYTCDTNSSENKAEANKIIQMVQFSRIFGIQVNLIKIKRLTCDLVCWAWTLPSRHCHHS